MAGRYLCLSNRCKVKQIVTQGEKMVDDTINTNNDRVLIMLHVKFIKIQQQ